MAGENPARTDWSKMARYLIALGCHLADIDENGKPVAPYRCNNVKYTIVEKAGPLALFAPIKLDEARCFTDNASRVYSLVDRWLADGYVSGNKAYIVHSHEMATHIPIDNLSWGVENSGYEMWQIWVMKKHPNGRQKRPAMTRAKLLDAEQTTSTLEPQPAA